MRNTVSFTVEEIVDMSKIYKPPIFCDGEICAVKVFLIKVVKVIEVWQSLGILEDGRVGWFSYIF